jgi:hypothetical protein
MQEETVLLCWCLHSTDNWRMTVCIGRLILVNSGGEKGVFVYIVMCYPYF